MITTEQIETIRKALLTEQSHKRYAENHLAAMKLLTELEKLASNTEIIGGVVRSISVYSSCEDERLDYRKDYVFHHFVSKRKALIEDKESGNLMEVHYSNFRFA